MKVRIVHIVSMLFAILFLANGLTELMGFYKIKMNNKAAIASDMEMQDDENGEKEPECKNIFLSGKTSHTFIPVVFNQGLKTMLLKAASWSNISLPVFTPPPETSC
ncbi:MAG: hypothetical protein JST09_10880 [Bacteroidetes bacterium]|nr:hypothetical protein [Bacteroidota bacterium]